MKVFFSSPLKTGKFPLFFCLSGEKTGGKKIAIEALIFIYKKGRE
jgi:hypothetical protein